MPTTVRSHAKINLGLYIGAPRPDGFHCARHRLPDPRTPRPRDRNCRASGRQTSIRLTSNDPRVPTDTRNTAWKMVAWPSKPTAHRAEVEIHIEKRLPVQGGLGAGSANAIAALIGLETELSVSARLPPRHPSSWLTQPIR